MKAKLIILLAVLGVGLVGVAQDGFRPVPQPIPVDAPKMIEINGETYMLVFPEGGSPTNAMFHISGPTNTVVNHTNTDTALPETLETLQPIWSLLKGRSGTLVTMLLSWLAVVSAAIAPFAVRIRNRLADALNTQSDKKIDPNGYLLRLFSSTPYRVVAFLLNFINIRFPTLAELERAIALQQEAVDKFRGYRTVAADESMQPQRASGESRARQLQELDRLLAEAGKIKAALAGPTVPVLPVTKGTV